MSQGARARAAQLELWDRTIRVLAERTQRAGVQARYEDLMCIDELKALHAIAEAKSKALDSAAAADRPALHTEFESVWAELASALDRLRRRGRPRDE